MKTKFSSSDKVLLSILFIMTVLSFALNLFAAGIINAILLIFNVNYLDESFRRNREIIRKKAFLKVYDCINSCKRIEHVNSCWVLLNCYLIKFKHLNDFYILKSLLMKKSQILC